MVPKRFGDFLEYREVTGTPPGKLMGLMGHSGQREDGHKRRRMHPPCPIRIGQGAQPPFPSSSPPLSPSPTPTREVESY